MRTNALIIALCVCACGDSSDSQGGGAGTAGDGPASAGRDGGDDGGRSGDGAGASGGRGGANAAGRSGAGGTGGMDEDDDDGGTAGDASDGGMTPVQPPPGACLADITSYTESGPFEFSIVRSGQVQIWVPDVPADCRLPVVHFSNATAATCAAFAGIIERLASHGFLTACHDNASTFDGTRCVAALQTVFDEYPDLADTTRIGSTGQETGGDAALACVYRAEQTWGDAAAYAGHAVAPFASHANWQDEYAQIESPTFVFNGTEDVLVSEGAVRMAYEALSGEKYWYEATGAPHIPVPVSWAAESAVVFFRWKLLGDEAAGEYFADMPDGDLWDLQEQDPGP